MANIVLYFHAGAGNHGCEAIIRSTRKILSGGEMTLFSSCTAEDAACGLGEIVTLREDINRVPKLGAVKKFVASVSHKLRGDDYHFYTFGHADFFRQIRRGDICLSVGGDNYCYNDRYLLGIYNKKLHRLGAKTVLWGCSVEPEMIDESVRRDLATYDLIVARESISYQTLKAINPRTVLCCDPAFQLDREQTVLPEGFVKGKTVGINASPLAAGYGSAELFMENYRRLIRRLTETTDFQIALIPHVVKSGNDDRTTLRALYESAPDKSRVVIVSDRSCGQLKTVISQCEMFVGARTHATIAAYSTCVPTLVTGYSVKARGIARDIFGDEKGYVVSVQDMRSPGELEDAFCRMAEKRGQIKAHLEAMMPGYAASVLKAKNKIDNLG